MKHGSRWIANYIGTILLLGVFAVGALILVNVGVNVYNNVVITNNNNFTLRTSLNYIATKVRALDTAGNISIGQVAGEDAIILSEEVDGDIYNTYIYRYNGSLCELVQKAGYDISPEYGFEIVEVNNFSIVSNKENAFTLKIENTAGDTEEMNISLRTEVGQYE